MALETLDHLNSDHQLTHKEHAACSPPTSLRQLEGQVFCDRPESAIVSTTHRNVSAH